MRSIVRILTFLSLVGLFSTSVFAAKKSAAKTLKLDTKESFIRWTGKKPAGVHFGKLRFTGGWLKLEGSHLVDAKFEVDMESLTVDDIRDPKSNAGLLGHLKKPDFFDTDNHKKAQLKVKHVQVAKGGGYDVIADLTIKKITSQVSFKVNLERKDKTTRAKTNFSFDRTRFGIKYKSKKFFDPKVLADKFIYDNIDLEVDVVAKN